MENFKVGLAFSEKMVWCSSKKFYIEPFTNVESHRRFNLAWKEIFWKVSRLALLFRKMVLYLWSKFSILKHCTNIRSLRRLELRFWQTSKQVYRKLQYEEKFLFKVSKFALLPQKDGFVFV